MRHNDEHEEDIIEPDEDEGSPGDEAAEVTCPHCGEVVEITLDAGGGADQEYVEDCEICCRPWHVHVRYDDNGTAEVHVEAGQ